MQIVDARGLESPEPFARVMDALLQLEPGESLLFRVDRVPYPLFRILDRDGYVFYYEESADGSIEVNITLA